MTSANDLPARDEAGPDAGVLSPPGLSLRLARQGRTGRRTNSSVLSGDAAEARQQILAAAERVIARYGVSKTTMDDIGKQAGVSRPTVYRYFGDRDNLLGALIERRARMLFDRARNYIFGFESFAEQLVERTVVSYRPRSKGPDRADSGRSRIPECDHSDRQRIGAGRRTDRRDVGAGASAGNSAGRNPFGPGRLGGRPVAGAGAVHPGRAP